jgi:serine/threonine-protein kinase
LYCTQCATPIPDKAKFCHNCGSLVSDAEGQAEATASMTPDAFAHMEQMLREDTAGEFTIQEMLGKGGMAVVYLATEVLLARKVAIKVLPPELTFGHGVERFMREAKTAAALDHPNIIPIYRISGSGKIFWYAMKYLEGESLDERVKRVEKLSLHDTLNILHPAADALDYAHEHGVIHRDVKPANIMIDTRGRVVVTDFGIAKALTEGTITASGSVVGTPHYMSPEQGMGKPVTAASDIYAVGIMAYRMLSGRVPFEADSAIAVLQKHCMEPPPALQHMQSGLPEHVYRAVHKAIEKKPADRFKSVTGFIQALERPTAELGDYRYDATAATLVDPRSYSRVSTEVLQTPQTIPPIREKGGRRGLKVAGALTVLVTAVAAAVVFLGPFGGVEPTGRTGDDAAAVPPGGPQAELPSPSPADPSSGAAGDPAAGGTAPAPPAPTTGVLRFTGLPRGAAIGVDGQRLAGTSGEFTPGSHRIEIRAQGFVTQSERVTVAAGDTTEIRFSATRAPPPPVAAPAPVAQTGTLIVGLRPPGDLFVNDSLVATSQSRWTGEVPAGVMIRLRYSIGGVAQQDTSVTVRPGARETIVLRGR